LTPQRTDGSSGVCGYLVHTWPDLAFSVGYVNRFMVRPAVEHMGAVKRLLYITVTIDYALVYPSSLGEAQLVGYSDSDFFGKIDTQEHFKCSVLPRC
jgi:hypothetical protein